MYILRICDNFQYHDFLLNDKDRFSVGEKNAEYLVPHGIGYSVFKKNGAGWIVDENSDGSFQPVESGTRYVQSVESGSYAVIYESTEAFKVNVPIEREILIARKKAGITADILLPDKSRRISAKHARIFKLGGKYYICTGRADIEVFINGHLIECLQNIELKDGDIIAIENYYFKFYRGRISSYWPFASSDEYVAEESAPFFSRSPRLLRQIPKAEHITLQEPPSIGEKPSFSWLEVFLTPLIFLGLSIAGVFAIGVYSLAFMIPGIILAIVNYRKAKKNFAAMGKLKQEKYQNYIEQKILQKGLNFNEACRNAVLNSNPDTSEVIKFAIDRSSRLWERTSEDEDFLQVRIGVGTVESAMEYEIPETDTMLSVDPMLTQAIETVNELRQIKDYPIVVDLVSEHAIGIAGDSDDNSTLLNNIISQISVLHGYDDVRIVLYSGDTAVAPLRWMRWLPHMNCLEDNHRYISLNEDDNTLVEGEIKQKLTERLETREEGSLFESVQGPHFVVVVNNIGLFGKSVLKKYLNKKYADLGISFIFTAASYKQLPAACNLIINSGENPYFYSRNNLSDRTYFAPDKIEPEQLEQFARSLAPLRLSTDKGRQKRMPNNITFLEGFGVRTPGQLDVSSKWKSAKPYESLAVPIGVKEDGAPFFFNIHEKGHGVHGVITGSTGSGKTEVIQTWLLSLALHFPPQNLAMVLIDFKGSSMFAPLKDLPHIAGTISNLDVNITRNFIALNSELQRRQEIVSELSEKLGHKVEISEINKLYAEGKIDYNLPYLIIVIDEYAEFKKTYEDLVDSVNSLFRLGRALGMFVVLATQDASGIITNQIESNVGFRWCLRVDSASQSKDMIGTFDASYIVQPGRGYIKSRDTYEKIQSYFVGAKYHPPTESDFKQRLYLVSDGGTRESFGSEYSKTGFVARGEEVREISVITDYISNYAKANGIPGARHIWEDQLPSKTYLQQVSKTGFNGDRWPNPVDGLKTYIGVYDDPRRQRRDNYVLNLSEDGHCFVFGGPSAGKTTTLQTIVVSLALRYSPELLNFHLIDYDTWTMKSLFGGLPHVGAIAYSSETEKVKQILRHAVDMIEARRATFSASASKTLHAYNLNHEDKLPYTVIVVDNLSKALEDYELLEDYVRVIIQEGTRYGVLLVCSYGKALPAEYEKFVTNRIVHHLIDANSYNDYISGTSGMKVPEIAGRSFVRVNGYAVEMQTALTFEVVKEGNRIWDISEVLKRMSEVYSGPPVDMGNIMPDEITIAPETSDVSLGLTFNNKNQVRLDFKKNKIILLSYYNKACKSNAVKLMIPQLIAKTQGETVILMPEEDPVYRFIAGEKIVGVSQVEEYLYQLKAALPTDDYYEDEEEIFEDENTGCEVESEDADTENSFSLPTTIVINNYHNFEDLYTKDCLSVMNEIAENDSLGINMILIGDAEELKFMYAAGDDLLNAAEQKGKVLLLGGTYAKHLEIGRIDHAEETQILGEFDGYEVAAGRVRKFRLYKFEA